LGHKSFAFREAAARELIEAGTRAIPALTAALRDKDLEVAERCRRLIPAAVAAERNKLFAQLLREPAGPPPKGLAGAARFLEIAGDNRATRRLYADLLTAHAAIVEALEVDPRAAARLLAEFAEQCIERAEAAELAGRDPFALLVPSRADLALFLFVRGDPRFDDTETVGGLHTMLLLRASRMKSDVAGPEPTPAMRRLFPRWLAAERQTDEMHVAFEIARQAGLAEALPLALKAATDPRKAAGYRAGLL